MARKDDITLAKQIAFKRLRGRVRLELNVLGDKILNDLLPEFEQEFDRRVAAGEPYELTSYDEWVVGKVNDQLALSALTPA
mgnify:CR=1 FL=1